MRRVLRAFFRHPPTTVSTVMERTGLSRPAVDSIVEELTATGRLAETGPVTGSAGGRPARRFRFRPEAGALVGIELGWDEVTVAVHDLEGTPLAETSDPVTPRIDRRTRLAVLDASLDAALRAAGTTRDAVRAAVVGTPGVVDEDGVVVRSLLARDWAGPHLRDHLRSGLEYATVLVENDARLGALGEQDREPVSEAVFLLCGRWTGIGLIMGGRAHRGSGGAAGEIASRRRWTDPTAELIDALRREDAHGSMRAVTGAAEAGNPATRAALDRFASAIAEPLADLALTTSPEVVVVGGALAGAGDHLVHPLRDALAVELARELPGGHAGLVRPRVRATPLAGRAVALGGVALGREIVERALFGA